MKNTSYKQPVLLLDIDGVLNLGEKFSYRYTRQHGVPKTTLAKFFDGTFQDCLVGKADLRVELAPVLKDWGWKGTVDSLLEYWFLDEVQLDQQVLDLITRLRTQGVRVYGASNQEHHRSKHLMENTQLKDYIDTFFISAHLGVKKPDPLFFQKVVDSIGTSPENILFWDDDERNVEGAETIGILSHVYKDYDIFSQQVRTYFHMECSSRQTI
jgi:putative hydrolase of the HAD superfamily